MKTISNKAIWLYCAPEFAVGLFTAMVSNYLIYFYLLICIVVINE